MLCCFIRRKNVVVSGALEELRVDGNKEVENTHIIIISLDPGSTTSTEIIIVISWIQSKAATRESTIVVCVQRATTTATTTVGRLKNWGNNSYSLQLFYFFFFLMLLRFTWQQNICLQNVFNSNRVPIHFVPQVHKNKIPGTNRWPK